MTKREAYGEILKLVINDHEMVAFINHVMRRLSMVGYIGPTFNGPTFNGPTFNGPTFNGPTFNGPTFTP